MVLLLASKIMHHFPSHVIFTHFAIYLVIAAVHPSRRSERASSSQTVSLPTISLHRVSTSSAGRTQRHRMRYWWRSRRCASFTRPQLSFRLCRPLHSTVNPTIQVLRHRAATRVVPFIPNRTYAGVYHPLWPNSSNTAHVRCATRLESWSGTIYLIHRIFLILPSIPHVCRWHTVLQSLCYPAFPIHSVVVTGHSPSPTSSVESQNH